MFIPKCDQSLKSNTYLSTSKYPLLRLLSYMRGYRKDYLLALLYSTLNKLFDIFPEILLGVAVNMVVSKQGSWIAQITGINSLFSQLLILGLLTFFIWACESYFQYLYSLKWRNLAQNIEHKLRTDVYGHIQKANVQQIESTSTGQMISTINDDINQMERFLEDGVNQIVQIIVSTIFIGIVFLFASPLITLLAIVPIPCIIVGAFYFQHRLAPRFLEVRQKAAEISGDLQRNLLNLLTIKSYTTEDYEAQRIEKVSANYQAANRKTIQISSMVTPVIRMFVLTGFLFTLLIGGYQTFHGQMNVGTFSMLIFLSQRLLWPFNNLAVVTVDYQRVMASTTRVLNLLTWSIEDLHNKVSPSKLITNHQDITLDHVTFGYENNVPVYQDLSLCINAQQTTAFVGESGSGKSTLIKLMCQFYIPQSGTLKYGTHNIQSFDLSSWRQQIALVSQDSFLFDGSIRENIAYGSFDANSEAIIHAAKVAGLHEFVMQLPNGYNTDVGQRGLLLSGGQKQRICIARAVLKDAPILILDEATSAVDNETELAIQRALNKISKSKTTIIIAHRLSTIRHADIIHVMDQGQIIESGTHQELLNLKGKYAQLWDIQTGNMY
ncbi:ABC transporter ATP-binding protein [Cysteiniphilum halobium]|uniref:ABC transporter ATP-binding protein n=1 Tax=Cysteiniphilum halobium TaxID=2219059 RepID=UPI000E655C29|nr:ABC transporter ATP-binding protein [Cysteiniphilum halobium]